MAILSVADFNNSREAKKYLAHLIVNVKALKDLYYEKADEFVLMEKSVANVANTTQAMQELAGIYYEIEQCCDLIAECSDIYIQLLAVHC